MHKPILQLFESPPFHGVPLTDRQGEYVTFIGEHIEREGYAPTEEEIAEAFGVRTASVHAMLKRLEKAGAIERTPGRPRSTRVLVEPIDRPLSHGGSEMRQAATFIMSALGALGGETDDGAAALDPPEVEVEVARRPGTEDLPLPGYRTDGASGMDVVAACEEPIVIEPGRFALVPTGLSFEVPRGFELQVRARSGLALRHGLFVLNAPGTIDSDYRGEVGILLASFGPEAFTVERGQRIAQLVLAPVVSADLVPVDRVRPSARGAGGFGSTGV